MADYRLSSHAQHRLDDIYYESFARFGAEQARKYLLVLHEAMKQLTNYPSLGEPYDHPLAGLRRKNIASHAIYYVVEGSDILVIDVLHQSMLPDDHLPTAQD